MALDPNNEWTGEGREAVVKLSDYERELEAAPQKHVNAALLDLRAGHLEDALLNLTVAVAKIRRILRKQIE